MKHKDILPCNQNTIVMIISKTLQNWYSLNIGSDAPNETGMTLHINASCDYVIQLHFQLFFRASTVVKNSFLIKKYFKKRISDRTTENFVCK